MLQIRTDQPVLTDRFKTMHEISKFWDRISPGWRIIWGDHIHHGFYEDTPNTTLSPQEVLIKRLADLLAIKLNVHILDAGCGMGGSSFFLAKHYHAQVVGITLSKKQLAMARAQAEMTGTHNVDFHIEDALSLKRFSDQSFDIVWSLESCEQFYNKQLFIQEAARVLKPGGQLLIATWCSNRDIYDRKEAAHYLKLCKAFDVPYMPTISHYVNLLSQFNFSVAHALNWSSHVKQSWDLGIEALRHYPFWKIFSVVGWRGFRFTQQIKLMKHAYHIGQVQYGVLVGKKVY